MYMIFWVLYSGEYKTTIRKINKWTSIIADWKVSTCSIKIWLPNNKERRLFWKKYRTINSLNMKSSYSTLKWKGNIISLNYSRCAINHFQSQSGTCLNVSMKTLVSPSLWQRVTLIVTVIVFCYTIVSTKVFRINLLQTIKDLNPPK